MPTLSYLKHQIHVTPGTRSSGEVAFVEVDGAQRCFLGGEREARRFLRERAQGEHYGPRSASWGIRLASGCSSSYMNAEGARSDAAYYRAQGMSYTLAYTLLCSHPGCDGSGEIHERGARGMVVDRPCPCHQDPVLVAVEEWRAPDTVQTPEL